MPKLGEKGRWISITFTHWDGLPSGKEAPVIILKLEEGNLKEAPLKELAKATYYYPNDDKADDFRIFMGMLTEKERAWVWRIIGSWIE